jgi:hypothetical protein
LSLSFSSRHGPSDVESSKAIFQKLSRSFSIVFGMDAGLKEKNGYRFVCVRSRKVRQERQDRMAKDYLSNHEQAFYRYCRRVYSPRLSSL